MIIYYWTNEREIYAHKLVGEREGKLEKDLHSVLYYKIKLLV